MTFLLLWSLRAAAMIALSFLFVLALRRRSVATRNVVLRVALVAAWLVPLAALVAPRVEVALPTPALAPSKAPSLVGTMVSEPMPLQEGWSVVQPDPKDVTTLGFERQTAFSSAWVPAVAPFLLLWWGGTGLVVFRWLFGLRRVRRLRREARPTDDPDVWRAAIAVPATYSRTILLPIESQDWPEARTQAAILHERAHVARRDWHWQTLMGLFAALHWPNPASWLLLRALRDTAEAAADDEALAVMRPSDYARELLAVAASVGSTGPALAMARRGGVVDRVAAILADRERHRPTRLVGGFLLVTILGAGVAVAGVQTQGHDLASARTDPSVSLLDVREVAPHPSLRWNARGETVATPHDVAQRYYVPGLADRSPGERLLEVRFRLPNAEDLTQWVLRPLDTDTHATFGISPHRKQSMIEAAVYAPKNRAQEVFRIGHVSGSWRSIPIPTDGFVVRIPPHSPWVRKLEVPWPSAIAPWPFSPDEVRIKFEIREDNGKLIDYSAVGYRDAKGKRIASFFLKGKGKPARVALWKRPYSWTTVQVPLVRPSPLKNVPLQPATPVATAGTRSLRDEGRVPLLVAKRTTNERDDPYARRLLDGRVLRLVDVREPLHGKEWSPSGRSLASPSHHTFERWGSPPPSGFREFDFTTDGDDFQGFFERDAAGGGSGRANDGNMVFTPECSFAEPIPRTTRLRIGYPSGPWKPLLGTSPSFKVESRSASTPPHSRRSPVFYALFSPLKLDPHTPQRIVGYDAEGRMMLPLIGPSGNGERVSEPFSHVPVRLEVQTRRIAWATFDAVHLVPNP